MDGAATRLKDWSHSFLRGRRGCRWWLVPRVFDTLFGTHGQFVTTCGAPGARGGGTTSAATLLGLLMMVMQGALATELLVGQVPLVRSAQIVGPQGVRCHSLLRPMARSAHSFLHSFHLS